jgi:hypothetical protein
MWESYSWNIPPKPDSLFIGRATWLFQNDISENQTDDKNRYDQWRNKPTAQGLQHVFSCRVSKSRKIWLFAKGEKWWPNSIATEIWDAS